MAAIQEQDLDFVPALEKFGLTNRRLYLNRGHSGQLIDNYLGYRQFERPDHDLSIPCSELQNLMNKHPESFPLLLLKTIDQVRQVPHPLSVIKEAGLNIQQFNGSFESSDPSQLLVYLERAISSLETACSYIEQIDVTLSTVNYLRENFDYLIHRYKKNQMIVNALDTLRKDKNRIFKEYNKNYTGINAQLIRHEHILAMAAISNYYESVLNLRNGDLSFQFENFSLYGDDRLK